LANGCATIKFVLKHFIYMISVCIPVWKERAGTLEVIVAGVMKSTLWNEEREKELLICVNGLKESAESLAAANALGERHPNLVKVLTLEKKGKNAAWEEIVKHSNPKSRTLFFTDADSILEQNTFTELDKALTSRKELAIASTVLERLQENFGIFEPFRKRIASGKPKITAINGPCYAIKREDAVNVKMPVDQRIHDDMFLTEKFRGRFAVVQSARIRMMAPSLKDWRRQRLRHIVSWELLRNMFPGEMQFERNPGPRQGVKASSGKLVSLLHKASLLGVETSADRHIKKGKDPWKYSASQRGRRA